MFIMTNKYRALRLPMNKFKNFNYMYQESQLKALNVVVIHFAFQKLFKNPDR